MYLFVSAVLLATASAYPPNYPNIWNNSPNNTGEPYDEAQYRASAVKEAFQFAWDGYYKYAFPNDELLPVNSSFSNSRYVERGGSF